MAKFLGEKNLRTRLPELVSKKECKIGNCKSKKIFIIILNGCLIEPNETVNPLYNTQNIHIPEITKVIWQTAP